MDDKQYQLRRLSKALLFSGALNIMLVAFLFYGFIKETPPTPYCELKPANKQEQQAPLAVEYTNADVVRLFKALSFDQLVTRLTNTQLVENGFTQRDLALAALVSFHHLDLSRALLGHPQPAQQRKIQFGTNTHGETVEVVVYPGFSEQQFQAIIQFAHTERWPMTSHGLYALLRKQGGEYDPSLADAFFLTSEFLSVEILFNRSEVHIDKTELLTVLCQGTWKMLSSFAEQQRVSQDLSPARRQKFLLDYIGHESRAAAYVLIKSDPGFASNKLDDNQVLTVLNLLVVKTPEAEKFALALLMSPRSDGVWQLAASKLFDYAGDLKPEKNIHHAALQKFGPQLTHPLATQLERERNKQRIVKPIISKPIAAIAKERVKPSMPMRTIRSYIVQEGDSLWKIAKKFKIDIDKLKDLNRLDSDFLKPGTSLKIP